MPDERNFYKVEKWSRDGQRQSLLTNRLCLLWCRSGYHTDLEGANYEAFYRCCSCWGHYRRIALNVGIGVPVFGPQF